MVTTTQNTLYIGWILEAPTISSKKEILDITIFPVLEGYIDEERRKICINVDRLEELDDVSEPLQSHDNASRNTQLSPYSIVLPTSEIITIRNFEKMANRNFTVFRDNN